LQQVRIGDVVQHQIHPANAGHGAVVVETDEIGAVVDSGVLLLRGSCAMSSMRRSIPFQHQVVLRGIFAHQVLLGAEQKTAGTRCRVDDALAGFRIE